MRASEFSFHNWLRTFILGRANFPVSGITQEDPGPRKVPRPSASPWCHGIAVPLGLLLGKGCFDSVPQWMAQATGSIASPFWKMDVWDHSMGKAGPPESHEARLFHASPLPLVGRLGLQTMCPTSAFTLTWGSPCVHVSVPKFLLLMRHPPY